jgi:hypothetical protein
MPELDKQKLIKWYKDKIYDLQKIINTTFVNNMISQMHTEDTEIVNIWIEEDPETKQYTAAYDVIENLQ